MKIKKFRVRPRLSSVARILKLIMSVKQLPADIEESLPSESQTFFSHVVPLGFYQTWMRDRMPATFEEPLRAAGAEKAVAVSALVATIGTGAEEHLSTLLMNGETARSQVVTALAEESADQAFNFLLRLLSDDAANDDCDVLEPVAVTQGPLLSEILGLLEASGQGVTVDPASHLSPRFTRVALAAWLPVAKKRRSPLTQKRR